MIRKILPAIFLVLYWLPASSITAQSDFRLIVNDSSSIDSVSKQELSRLFLKKVSKWSDGTRVKPVDQVVSRPIRGVFSEEIHGRNSHSIQSYWRTLIFSGRETPPPALKSDADVVEYVREHPGAVGYLEGRVPADSGVKQLRLTKE